MRRELSEELGNMLPEAVQLFEEYDPSIQSTVTHMGVTLSARWIAADTRITQVDAKTLEGIFRYEVKSMALQLAELADQLAADLREAAG